VGGGYYDGNPWVTGFDGTTATFKNAAFWNAIASRQPLFRAGGATPQQLYDEALASPYVFKHFVSYCKFVWNPEPTTVYREAQRVDGTYPRRPDGAQYANDSVALRVESEWGERSWDFQANNTFLGWPNIAGWIASDTSKFFLYRTSETISTINPGAKWPRTQNWEFPQQVILGGHGYGAAVPPVVLPASFEF
jgi:hypothetical protein